MAIRVVYPMLTSNRIMASGTVFRHLLLGAGIGLLGAAIVLAVTLRKK
jgi:hypothetical protein